MNATNTCEAAPIRAGACGRRKAAPTIRVLHVINGEHYAGAERVQDSSGPAAAGLRIRRGFRVRQAGPVRAAAASPVGRPARRADAVAAGSSPGAPFGQAHSRPAVCDRPHAQPAHGAGRRPGGRTGRRPAGASRPQPHLERQHPPLAQSRQRHRSKGSVCTASPASSPFRKRLPSTWPARDSTRSGLRWSTTACRRSNRCPSDRRRAASGRLA